MPRERPRAVALAAVTALALGCAYAPPAALRAPGELDYATGGPPSRTPQVVINSSNEPLHFEALSGGRWVAHEIGPKGNVRLPRARALRIRTNAETLRTYSTTDDGARFVIVYDDDQGAWDFRRYYGR